jgi:hypothetical protein
MRLWVIALLVTAASVQSLDLVYDSTASASMKVSNESSSPPELLGASGIPPYRGAGGITAVHGDVTESSAWVINRQASELGYDPQQSPTCETALTTALNGVKNVGVTYDSQADGGVQLTEVVATDDQPSSLYRSVVRSLARCRTFSYRPHPNFPDGGYVLHGTIRRVELRSYGTESSAFIQVIDDSALLGKGFPNLPIGASVIQYKNRVMLLAFNPDESSFSARQLEPFIVAALAALNGEPLHETYPQVRVP